MPGWRLNGQLETVQQFMHGDTLHSVSLRHLARFCRDGGRTGMQARRRLQQGEWHITLNGQQLRATVICQQHSACCSCTANGWK
jgi:3-methylcrotonyl-CoA carboxylase alpha subunit